MENPTFKTERTLVTLATPDHALLLHNYLESNAAHLAPWEPVRAPDYATLTACIMRLQNSAEAARQDREFQFMLLDPQSTEMIGLCNYSNIVRGSFQACHLGYSISAKYQGQGLMFEVLQIINQWVFDQLDLHRIMANYISHNQRSGNLLARLGFETEGYAKKYLKIAGTWQDHVLTAKVRERD